MKSLNDLKPSILFGTLCSFLLLASCMPEVTDPTLPLNDQVEIRTLEDDYPSFPLENLRMDPTTLKMLADLRAATAKYHRLEVALEDGYALPEGGECVSTPNGAMGYHYVNFGLVDGEYDPTMPEALLYEGDEEGRMRLVGVEFVIVADLWDAENEDSPYFGIQEFDEVFPPVPLEFRNYQLHVWIWRNNPNGIFTPFNPKVSCE